MIEKEILVKNLKINYKVIGRSGFPVLILHGWGSSSEKWQKVAELLAENNIQVVVPDLPGFGKSQEPETAWNTDNYVEWAYEFSNSVPELKREFFLLGHSFGGGVAAKFSVKYNQRVKKLFLVAAHCVRKVTLKKQLLPKISRIFKIFSVLPLYDLIKKTFYKFIVGGSDYLNVEKTMKETFLKIISEDLTNYLIFIKVPTIIIWGDEDKLTPLSEAKIINEKIEGSKLVIVKGAKHALQISSPAILSERILENMQ